MGNHKQTAKQYTWHKIRHRYLKLNKTPAQIADELNLDPEFVDRVCEHLFLAEF